MKNIIFLVFVLNGVFSFSQNNYYIAVSGNDSNPGTLTNPWRHIQYGCNQLIAGDTLNIRAGVYAEKIDLDVSGTPNAYITIRKYQNENVVLDAISFNDDNAIIWTDNAYLRIIGLHLTNNIINFAGGLALQGKAHDIEILHNKISNIKFSSDPNAPVTSNTNAVPLSIYADEPLDSIYNITIRNNEVFNNQTGYSENISCGGNFSGFLIEENLVHDNTNIGIDIGGNYHTCPTDALDHGRYGIIRNNIVYNCNSPYSTAAGIYIDGGFNIIVENNTCYHNGYGGEIGCEEDGTTENIIFRNNIFYENYYTGMHIGGYDVNTTGNVINAGIYNNTFYHNDTGVNNNGAFILTKSEDVTIENNIFYISDQNVLLYAERTQTNFDFDYNLVFATAGITQIETTQAGISYTGLNNFYTSTNQGSHAIFANPLFNDAANFNFHLMVNSPAINTGNPNYVANSDEYDIDHEVRINDTVIDCGADEYYNTASIDIMESNQIKPFPNPAQQLINVSNDLDNCAYQIINQQGQIISKGVVSNGTIYFNNLPRAIYFIKVRTRTNQDYSFKMVMK